MGPWSCGVFCSHWSHKVFEAEKAHHNDLKRKGLSVDGERFNLEAKLNGSETEFELLKQKFDGDELLTVDSGIVARAQEKNNYYEMEVKEWLTLGLVTLDEIVDLLIEGVFELVR